MTFNAPFNASNSFSALSARVVAALAFARAAYVTRV